MTISSISQSNYQGFAATGANVSAKPAADAQPDTAAKAVEASKAAEPATADTDAKDSSSSSSSSSSSAAPNMFKINPDGTVGPLHMPRAGHGSVHA